MLFTLTWRGHETERMGFLLYKNPNRVQTIDIGFGTATIFYSEVSMEKTTIAMILNIDPLELVKGKAGDGKDGLFAYVNDRPYVSSSFMSTAIKRVFGTAMTGRCEQYPELAGQRLDLTAKLYSLPVHGEKKLVGEVFEPLGYAVTYSTLLLDEKFREWGDSSYINLTLTGTVVLSELLRQLYLLIPVFDGQHHNYIAEDEVEKVVRIGGLWLQNHPQRKKIVQRYFRRVPSYAKKVLVTLTNESDLGGEEDPAPLDKVRRDAVKNAVLSCGAESVIDLGCGEGKLLEDLLKESTIVKLTGMDVSVKQLEKARKRLQYDDVNERVRNKLKLFQGSLMYCDERIKGYDAACVTEVIEHIDPERLSAFEEILLGWAAPKTVILTTPNRDYNKNYSFLQEDELRHKDHRFEFGKVDFYAWVQKIAREYGYEAEISHIGDGMMTDAGEEEFPTFMVTFHGKNGGWT